MGISISLDDYLNARTSEEPLVEEAKQNFRTQLGQLFEARTVYEAIYRTVKDVRLGKSFERVEERKLEAELALMNALHEHYSKKHAKKLYKYFNNQLFICLLKMSEPDRQAIMRHLH